MSANHEANAWRRGCLVLTEHLMHMLAGTEGARENAIAILAISGVAGTDGSLNWQALEQRWAEAREANKS